MRGTVVGAAALLSAAIVGLGAFAWSSFSSPTRGKPAAGHITGASERGHAASTSRAARSKAGQSTPAGELAEAPDEAAPPPTRPGEGRAPGDVTVAGISDAGAQGVGPGRGRETSAGAGNPAYGGGLLPSAGGDSRRPLGVGDLRGLAGGALGAGTGAGAEAGTACPADMVDVGAFCIDGTQVTNAAYVAFIEAGFPVRGQPAMCRFNTEFVPKDPITKRPDLPPADTRPVVNVSWCDAWAYCASAGKRMCGRIGGGPTPTDAFRDPTRSEWYRVCSNNGITQFAYGDTFDGTKCARPGADGSHAPVKSVPACVGTASPYDSVFDMSGSVGAWEDGCNGTAGGDDLCRTRGGGITSLDDGGVSALYGSCDYPPKDALYRRHQVFGNIGIRCCATRNAGF